MNLKDEGTLDYIVQIVESEENTQRILKNIKDYQIINGNQRYHIQEELKKRFPRTWERMNIIALKIGEKIIRKLSRVYSSGVKREVINQDTGEVDPIMTEVVNYIYADINEEGQDFNDILKRGNKHYTTHEYVEVFVHEDNDGFIRIKALPQHLFTAISNNEKTVAEVIVFKEDLRDKTNAKEYIDYDLLPTELENMELIYRYTVWSKYEQFSFIRVKGDNKQKETEYRNIVEHSESNVSGINPYGVFPFAAIKKDTEGHFYPYGSEIPLMSLECNLILCDLVSIAINQGFGQAVIYYDGDTPPKEINTGYTNVITIPNSEGKSKFEFANANADLQGLLNIESSIIRLLLSTNDLTTDKVSGELQATNFASAIDRLIADSETIEFVEDVRKKFINTEQKIFNIILEFLKYQLQTQSVPKTYPKFTLADLLKDLKLKVTFNSIKPMITEKEKIDTIKLAEESGLIMPYEKHLMWNESLTIEEAKQREMIIRESIEEAIEEEIESQLPRNNTKDQMMNDSQEEMSDTMEIEDEIEDKTEEVD